MTRSQSGKHLPFAPQPARRILTLRRAAALTTNNIAHVIFITHDVSFSKSLSKALPDRVFRQIILGDCTPEVAKRFVLTHLEADGDDPRNADVEKKERNLEELDETIAALGGRLTDLEFLARRIKTGETPKSKSLLSSALVCSPQRPDRGLLA